MRSKIEKFQSGGGYTHALWGKLIFGKVQAQLGSVVQRLYPHESRGQ